MIYNDGIHTVTSMATIYGTEELGLSTTELMVTLLLVQVVAIGGALIFSRLANRIGARRSVMFALVLWSGVVTYGYFIHTATEFFILGMVVGVVLGGTQALSRSFYGAMIPEQASAEFYGFYSVFSKFSVDLGTRNVRCYRTDYRQCTLGDHFVDDILYRGTHSIGIRK